MSLPTGTEIAKALSRSDIPIPVDPIKPVGTYPSAAPPGSPTPTPQPVYQTADPTSRWSMNPMMLAFFKSGFAGVVVFILSVLLAWIIRSQSSAQSANDAAATATQKALLESFAAVQKERSEEVKTLTQGILATQVGLQTEIHGLSRVIEKLEAKLDTPKKEDPPPAAKFIGPIREILPLPL